jgi:PleD family two-component response regulator
MGLGRIFGKRAPETEPATEEQAVPEPESASEGESSGSEGIKVVIIDDDPDARDFMRMGLEVGGFEVVGEGGDGPSAIAAVGEGKPDLVLTSAAWSCCPGCARRTGSASSSSCRPSAPLG